MLSASLWCKGCKFALLVGLLKPSLNQNGMIVCNPASGLRVRILRTTNRDPKGRFFFRVRAKMYHSTKFWRCFFTQFRSYETYVCMYQALLGMAANRFL